MTRHGIEQAKGVLFLDALRRKLGDDEFLKLMSDYFAANTTKTVTRAVIPRQGRRAVRVPEPGDGPAYLTTDIGRRLAHRRPGLRHQARRRRQSLRRRADADATSSNQFESKVPIYKDFEVNDELLRAHDVIFVGRPEANSALAAWSDRSWTEVQRSDVRDRGADATPASAKRCCSPRRIRWTPRTWCWSSRATTRSAR